MTWTYFDNRGHTWVLESRCRRWVMDMLRGQDYPHPVWEISPTGQVLQLWRRKQDWEPHLARARMDPERITLLQAIMGWPP